MSGLNNSEEGVSEHLRDLPESSVQVLDPDEEIFLLYTRLAAKHVQDGSQTFTGLGSVDSRQDTLTLNFEAPNSAAAKTTKPTSTSRNSGKKAKLRIQTSETVEIHLAQDKTALRTRKGDTGSVLWRVSVDFSRFLMKQLYSRALLDPATFSDSHVLELGAGTGLLCILLSRWVRHYTVTDLEAIVPLIRKNLDLNHLESTSCHNITVDSLDWVALRDTAVHARRRFLELDTPVDIVLAIDCIYNPSLLSPLVEALDYYSMPGRTMAVVVVELRSEDVIREFLELWLAKGGWEIFRVGGEEDGWMDASYVIWVGWKVERTEIT